MMKTQYLDDFYQWILRSLFIESNIGYTEEFTIKIINE